MMSFLTPALLLSLALTASSLFMTQVRAQDHKHHGQEHKHHEHDQALHNQDHGAHTHGLANLTLVMENKLLNLHLLAPAESLLGFEHLAQTSAEKQQVENVRKILRRPDNVSNLAQFCKAVDIKINTAAVLPADNAPDNPHLSHRDHAEIELNYRFKCAGPEKITKVSISLFEHFPRLERIRVIWLTDSAQGLRELSPDSTEFNLG